MGNDREPTPKELRQIYERAVFKEGQAPWQSGSGSPPKGGGGCPLLLTEVGLMAVAIGCVVRALRR